jgi:glucose-6-phosphate 1-epimerase
MHLQICNTGARAFEWSGGLHPYFYVDDLLQVQVKGLQNTAYEDRYPIKPSVPLQEENCMGFDGAPIERLYQGCPPLKLVQARRHLQLSCTGFSQWMIWNPGEAGQAQFSDLPPGDWRHFICIEPVIASHSQKLEPGQCFEGTLSIEVIKG